MALSGEFTGTTSNARIIPKIVWSATQSVSGNYSKVTATLYYSKTTGSQPTTGTGTWSVTINGETYSATAYLNIIADSDVQAVSHTVTVPHSSDGSKKVTISGAGQMNVSGSSLSSTTISATVTLDTIPRATTPELSATSADMGDTVDIDLPRASSKFTHDLSYSFAGGSYVTIATGQGTSYTWTVPDLASKIPKAASGTVTIKCVTKSGSTTIGTKTVLLTAKVPADVVPTVSKVTVSDVLTDITAQFGAYVQGKSIASVAITGAGVKGSTISAYQAALQGVTYTAESFTADITKSSDQVLKVRVKDSRGRWSAYKSVTLTVLAYSAPKITKLSVYRCDANGTADDNGGYMAASYTYSVASLGGKNTASAVLSAKQSTATAYSDLRTSTALSETLTGWTDGTAFTTDYRYNVRMTVTDWFGGTATASALLPSGGAILDVKADGEGLAIGKTAEEEGLDIGWLIKARNLIRAYHTTTPYRHTHPTSAREIGFGIGSGGANRGIYDYSSGVNRWMIYADEADNTILRGTDISFTVSSPGTATTYRPYLRKGDTVTYLLKTAGYAVGSAKEVSFVLPLNLPVIGEPTVTAVSRSGFKFFQNGGYTHGASSSKWVVPTAIRAGLYWDQGISVTAEFSTNTNATEYSPIGIYCSIDITFE